MTYAIVLALHVAAAVITIGLGAGALATILFNLSSLYRRVAVALGLVAGFEVATGTLMAVLSPTLSASALTLHIAEYLGACLVVEALLFIKMKKISLTFPTALTSAPVFASIALFVAAISYGF